MEMMDLRRLGSFSIEARFLDWDIDLVQKILGTVVVTKAGFNFGMQQFEYIAISEYFESVPISSVIPPYTIAHSRIDLADLGFIWLPGGKTISGLIFEKADA